jgi:hypothetical protein
MNLPEDPPEAYEDFFADISRIIDANGLTCKLEDIELDPDADRLEELHRAIGLGVDFNEFSDEDRALIMADVDAAMADAQADILRNL